MANTALPITQLFSIRSSMLALTLAALACSASPESDGRTSGPGAPGAGGGTAPTGSGGGISVGGSTTGGGGATTPEQCNGVDDDGNSLVDEGCTCTPGQTQSCFAFAKEKDSVGECSRGTQKCLGSGELGYWGDCEGSTGPSDEVCDNGIDEDCDGQDASCSGSGGSDGAGGSSGCVPQTEICGNGIDEDCDGKDATCDVVCQDISLFGDCLSISCPPSMPYPKSCQVFFTPGDDRGCVANAPGSSSVYFQAGDQCNAGFVTGKLCCAATPQAPLDNQSCPINKPVQYHVAQKSECPAVTD